jgi:hypothetical protein
LKIRINNHTINTRNHSNISDFHNPQSIKSTAFQTCKIHINHITDIPAQKAIIQLNHNPINSNPNNAISKNAVGFAMLAIVKNIHDKIIYFENSDFISLILSE